MKATFCVSQSLGAREEQEDSYGICWNNKTSEAFILADGMGGHVAGALASQSVIDSVKEILDHDKGFTNHSLKDVMTVSNRCLSEIIQSHPEYKGFGTTLLVAVVHASHLYWVSIGDSILFGVDHSMIIHRLNADHSMKPVLDAMVAAGELDETDERYRKQKTQLRSALTGDEIELYDLQTDGLSLSSYKYVGIASDGIESLSNDRITQILHELDGCDLETINLCIMDALKLRNKKNQDNTTLILMET